MQLACCCFVLAMCAAVDGVRVATRRIGSASPTAQYAEYALNDEHAHTSFDYNDEQGIQRASEENIEEDVDISNKYELETKYKPKVRYRRPHHRGETTASTEQWNDDIEVDISRSVITKKNKVAKTGSRLEYEKLKFAYKYTTENSRPKITVKQAWSKDVDSYGIVQLQNQDTEHRNWRNSDREQNVKLVMEESEVQPRRVPGGADDHDDDVYYDVKRLHQYKSNYLPLNYKHADRNTRKLFGQSMSSTSLAERELQAYLNGNRPRKAANVWSSTTECTTKESSPATPTLLLELTSIVPASDGTAGAPLVSAAVHHQRLWQASGSDAAGGTSATSAGRHNFTFPPLAVDAAFVDLWDRFIAETRNDALSTQWDSVIYMYLISSTILYVLQRYWMFFICFSILLTVYTTIILMWYTR